MTGFEALVGLNMSCDIGGARLKRLLEFFDKPQNIFVSSPDKLTCFSGIGPKTAQKILSFKPDELDKELRLAGKLGVTVITCFDNGYPANLLNIYDPPLVLYVKGKLTEADNAAVAIVGSRRASYYGLSCAGNFAQALSQNGITIISGMARGVDTYAHKGALKTGGRTVAVIGSGLNRIYPEENSGLAEEIASSGAVVSEFAMNTGPLRQNFPRRNRTISGLSLGVLVTEAAENSGALITANFAAEQGREVFALPGKIDSAVSRGANGLIKQGARLVSTPDEIIEELYLPLSSRCRHSPVEPEKINTAQAEAGCEEELVYDLIKAGQVTLDEVCQKTKIEIPRLLGILFRMQLKKRVRQLPGNQFAAC